MFVDEVVIDLIAGRGGDGCMAYRREKYIEMGGPYGGNGGNGSSIIFKASEGLNTLIDLRYQRIIKGKKGENGLGKGMTGSNAEDVIVKVPLGTVVEDADTGLILADLTENNQEVIVCNGGRGGKGNIALATRANLCPSYAEGGEPGEEKKVKVELKLLADVGLVGMPSVGKSTFISMISASKPKIAAYHFTTLKPNLGVVRVRENKSFVVADLPGLIKGASLGEGLGDRFLRHIERTRVIAHIIDMSGFEGRNPYEDYVTINNELKSFNPSILDKPQIVIANKMDIDGAIENLKEFKSKVNCKVFEASFIDKTGIDNIIIELSNMLDKIEKQPLYKKEQFASHVLYKFEEKEPFKITRLDNHTFMIKGEEIEKTLKMTKFHTEESAVVFATKLRKMGVDDKLRSMNAKEGDTIRILDFEFEYKE